MLAQDEEGVKFERGEDEELAWDEELNEEDDNQEEVLCMPES